MSASVQHYLSFRVGRQWYGVHVDQIIEVLHLLALTELPAAPPEILGLMTVRDMVMPVVDLRRRFGLGEAPLRLDTPIIAVRTPRGPIGLVVDEAEDVERIPAHLIAAHDGDDSPYITGVARLSDRLLLLLDTARLRAETRVPEHPPG